MKLLVWLVAASILLACLKAAFAIVALGLAFLLLLAAITRPRELLGYVVVWTLLYALERHPLGLALTMVTLCAIGGLARAWPFRRKRGDP